MAIANAALGPIVHSPMSNELMNRILLLLEMIFIHQQESEQILFFEATTKKYLEMIQQIFYEATMATFAIDSKILHLRTP